MAAKTSARVPRGRRGPTFIQRSRSVSSEEKAMHHNITGKVLREFFDLGQDDQDACRDALEKAVAMRLDKAGA
jgi:hypothetical protein